MRICQNGSTFFGWNLLTLLDSIWLFFQKYSGIWDTNQTRCLGLADGFQQRYSEAPEMLMPLANCTTSADGKLHGPRTFWHGERIHQLFLALSLRCSPSERPNGLQLCHDFNWFLSRLLQPGILGSCDTRIALADTVSRCFKHYLGSMWKCALKPCSVSS